MDDVQVIGLNVVVADMEAFPARLMANARKAVQVTAHKVRDDARSRISGHKYLPHYPSTITYDVKATAEGFEGEIGPDKSLRGQAPFGAFLEYGSVHNAPLPHLGPALDANAEDLIAGIEIAVSQAIT